MKFNFTLACQYFSFHCMQLSFDLLHPFFRYGSINVDTFSLVITRFQREHLREEREAALVEGSGST